MLHDPVIQLESARPVSNAARQRSGTKPPKAVPGPGKYTSQEREARAREDYHDPTAGIAGARQARSALTMRLIPASFGLLACAAGAVLFLTATIQPAIAAVWSFFAAVALADLVVVARRKLRGEPG